MPTAKAHGETVPRRQFGGKASPASDDLAGPAFTE